MTDLNGNRCFPMRTYVYDPPTNSPWVRRENFRKRMILMEINGGPGRTRTFDLPIMSLVVSSF